MPVLRPLTRPLVRPLTRRVTDPAWGGWSPRVLFAAGEQGAWYDPSDISTLYQDSAGTTPVTALGQPVGRMLDKSGRGNHASQPTATARPTLQADASGRKYLQFDGVDDFLATPSIDFTGTDKMFVVAGVRKESDPATYPIIAMLSENINTGVGVFALFASADTANKIQNAARVTGNRGIIYSSYGVGVSLVEAVSFDLSQLSVEAAVITRINGAAASGTPTSVGGVGSGNFGNYPLYMGGSSVGQRMNGRIYSLIVRGALSTDAQLAAAERYANSKTGAY